jgi:hypothetical protein
MARDSVLQLRYVGVFPQTGYREYRFNVEKENADIREVILTIADGLFLTNRLMFQEAPDLCYQKMLMDLRNESKETPICSHGVVTAMDIDSYRESHPATKTRKSWHRPAR